MSARTVPLITIVLGLAALIAFLSLSAQEAVSSVFALNEVSTRVSEFQRAETVDDIAAVFGAPPDARIVAAHNAINTRDLFGFIPAYFVFLTAAAIMLGGARNRWTLAAIGFAFVGAAADAVETSKQLQLTADLANAEAHLPIAPWHWLKYLGLSLHGVAIAGLALGAAPRRWLLAAVALAPVPLVAAACLDLLGTRAFAAAFGVFWLSLLVIAIMEAVRGLGGAR